MAVLVGTENTPIVRAGYGQVGIRQRRVVEDVDELERHGCGYVFAEELEIFRDVGIEVPIRARIDVPSPAPRLQVHLLTDRSGERIDVEGLVGAAFVDPDNARPESGGGHLFIN